MRVVTPLAVLVLLARSTVAQCPNGSPPPCAATVVAAPDPGRIAVFPFHVTTSDSLLGEGVAELVAGELTGEGGPRSVHMGSALRTWRRAGGGLRTPLDHAAEMRAASDLGAGLVLEGSVVGLGERLTLSAQVVSVPAGTIRRAAPVSGVSDSLPRLIQQLTAAVLVASGAPPREVPLHLSDSPAAVRAYIEGLALFRGGNFTTAAQTFDRAIAYDSQFVRASFMRWLTATWGPGFGSEAERAAARRARRDRAALSSDDQVVLDAAFGDLAVTADSALRLHGQEACAAILEFLSAPAADRAARLAFADSIIRRTGDRRTGDPVFAWSGLGELILARYWEAAGNPARGLTLLHSRGLGFPNWSFPATYRAEGRLAAAVGDTTGAIRAFREYLELRRFADAALVPQRDSVAAKLARLQAPQR